MPLEFTPVKADPELKKLGIHSDTYGEVDLVEASKELISLKDMGSEGKQRYIRIMRLLSKKDFFFFCYFALNLPVNHPFLVARVYDVQNKADKTLDLWARDHWKSTLLTLARPLWELILNREERICIFSHTRALAKAHLRKIKHELEQNHLLWWAFPDTFYHEPSKKAPKWSEDEGLYVRRVGNYPAASVEAWGLIEKQPAGKHFTIMVYDDIVTETAVLTKAQLEKVERQFRLSDALGTSRPKAKKRIIGTRYSHRDLYGKIIEAGNYEARIFPAEVDENGVFARNGKPVLLDKEILGEKYDDMGEYIYSAQMGQNPVSEGMQLFRRHWLRFWDLDTTKPYMNIYVIVDPAEVDTIGSDYTSMIVVGVDYMRNYWILDMIRDRIELGPKWEKLKNIVTTWRPHVVGYEINKGKADVQYYNLKMQEEGMYFNIVELKSYRGKSKHARVKALQAVFEKKRVILPRVLPYTDKIGKTRELVNEFIEDEYLLYPFPKHDDLLDSLGFILDPELGIFFPTQKHETKQQVSGEDPLNMRKPLRRRGSWMSY